MENITIAKAIVINGNKNIYNCIIGINKKFLHVITRSFLSNCSDSQKAKLRKTLNNDIYDLLVNGDIDLIAINLICSWDDTDNIDIMGDWFYANT